MNDIKSAIIGIGATGTVLAAALLGKFPDTFLIGRRPELGDELRSKGIDISGAIDFQAAVKHYSNRIGDLKDYRPDFIFLCTKTFHLEQVFQDLQEVFTPGIKIISTRTGRRREQISDVQNSHRVLVGSDHARPPCHRRHPHAALQSSLGSGHAK